LIWCARYAEILRIKEAFTKQRHTRFMKSFSYHLPFGTKDAYVREIMAADMNKLVKPHKNLRFPNADENVSVLEMESGK
jgi:hypothetical protein